jgi:Uma2 family endonuclease
MICVMNEHIRPGAIREFGEAGQRRRFTVDEFERMAECGILDHDERLELIEGDIHVMSPKGRRHEVLRSELLLHWATKRPTNLKMASETPLRLSDDTEPLPDLIVYSADLVAPDVRADTALLVVEISDSSLAYDLARKAAIYAQSGVAEYWVVSARDLKTRVHRQPIDRGYQQIFDVEGHDVLAPLAAPELSVRLADLPGL